MILNVVLRHHRPFLSCGFLNVATDQSAQACFGLSKKLVARMTTDLSALASGLKLRWSLDDAVRPGQWTVRLQASFEANRALRSNYWQKSQ